MLVAVGRAPLVSGIGLEDAGVAFDTRGGSGPTITAEPRRLVSMRSATTPGYWQLAHTAFREGEVAPRMPAATTPSSASPQCHGRSTPIPRSPVSA